ncbi:GAL4 enhancer protein [Mycoemilia scoparia]|uniref:Nascent polypeptide-associated complex subunit alpha n=1 Tax=Mycoemilia scoparia TaxID=417184 RepID=A0A9W8A797_9FUNG|nr:GAL4 enhancer protein [Mycoemilia scoparia]
MTDSVEKQQTATVEDVPEEVLAAANTESTNVDEIAAAAEAAARQAAAGGPIQDRRVRKAMDKLKLKQADNISMITMRRTNGTLFSIQNPEVFHNPKSSSWIVFGQARMRNSNPQLSQLLQQLQENPGALGAGPGSDEVPIAVESGKGKETEKNDDEDEEVDETGISAENIALVMEQANCSRAKAVKGIKEADNDVVTAIMNLTA